jgi:hypothetical protein
MSNRKVLDVILYTLSGRLLYSQVDGRFVL